MWKSKSLFSFFWINVTLNKKFLNKWIFSMCSYCMIDPHSHKNSATSIMYLCISNINSTINRRSAVSARGSIAWRYNEVFWDVCQLLVTDILEECSAFHIIIHHLPVNTVCAATKRLWEPKISRTSYPIWGHPVTWDHMATSYNGTLLKTMALENIWLPNNSTVTAQWCTTHSYLPAASIFRFHTSSNLIEEAASSNTLATIDVYKK